jgi:regulatory protein
VAAAEMREPQQPPREPAVQGDPVLQARMWLARHGGGTLADSSAEGECPMPSSGRSGGSGGPQPEVEDEDADPVEVARTIVLRKLAAQDRTRAELATVLHSRQVPDDVADVVLDRMSEVGLIDDAAFAERWVASRQRRRHLSRAALQRELATKGVGGEELAAAIADVDDDDELEAARTMTEKKAAGMAGLAPDVRYRRLAGALARRGFGPAIAARVLADVLRACGERPSDPPAHGSA